jgi:bifunctional NMN adenylyltransferase/nudix hydrolase
MSSKQYKVAVVIGRFQPFHSGHYQLMRNALDVADRLIIIVGSTNIPRTPKNPFTYSERVRMILGSVPPDKVDIYGIEDTRYSNQQWAGEVQFSVQSATQADDKDIVLVGHHRDSSSFYLDMFPQWKFIEMPAYNNDINGTAIRTEFYRGTVSSVESLPASTTGTMANVDNAVFQTLVQEYNYVQDYKKLWSNSPYPVTFVTTDAVVVQSGHVLMIKRGGFPGKGLWALPGGYVDANERIVDGIIRELIEETKLKVPEKVLRGSVKNTEVFDAPDRSERGRTITHAALIVLEEGHTLPRVKGSDDADEARWIPLSMLQRMRSEIFEDHYDIIFRMTSNL